MTIAKNPITTASAMVTYKNESIVTLHKNPNIRLPMAAPTFSTESLIPNNSLSKCSVLNATMIKFGINADIPPLTHPATNDTSHP